MEDLDSYAGITQIRFCGFRVAAISAPEGTPSSGFQVSIINQQLQSRALAPAAGDEFTGTMFNALVAHGGEQQVADRIAALPSFGAAQRRSNL